MDDLAPVSPLVCPRTTRRLDLSQFELREEQRANEARRAFMKYLFHEVRTRALPHYPTTPLPTTPLPTTTTHGPQKNSRR